LMLGSSERIDSSLLVSAEMEQTVQLLLDAMLAMPARESVIVNCVSVLLALLEIRRPAPQNSYASDQDSAPNKTDIERQEKVQASTVRTLAPRLPELVTLLNNPPAKPAVPTTAGTLNPPLGATRLSICKLVSTMLSTRVPELNPALATTSFLPALLDLFFKFSLNNFLHTQTELIVRNILCWEKKTDLDTAAAANSMESPTEESLQTPKVLVENPLESATTTTGAKEGSLEEEEASLENPLLVQLMTEARLLDRLISAWEEGGSNPTISYMGHVTQMSNELEKTWKRKEEESPRSNHLLLTQIMDKLADETRTRWSGILEGKLSEANVKNTIPIDRDEKRNNSSDDDSDFRDIQFPQDSTLQQMFTDYQMTPMSENFVDTFGFHDEEFNEAEDGIRGVSKLSPAVNFLMNTNDLTKKAVFESICETGPNRGFTDSDEDEEDEDIWAGKTTELTFGGRTTPDITKTRAAEAAANSSDEEEDAAPAQMEVDADPWGAGSADAAVAGAAVAMDTSVPWGSDDKASSPERGGEGWATFDQTQQASQEQGGGGGWADFSNLAAAGGEGFANFSGSNAGDGSFGEGSINEDTNANNSQGSDWNPTMSSSPGATMLDSEITSSPRRPESPDLANNDANQAPAAGSFGLSQSEVDKAGYSVSTDQSEAMNVNSDQSEAMNVNTDKSEADNAAAGQSETVNVNTDRSEVANFELVAPEPVSEGAEATPSTKDAEDERMKDDGEAAVTSTTTPTAAAATPTAATHAAAAAAPTAAAVKQGDQTGEAVVSPEPVSGEKVEDPPLVLESGKDEVSSTSSEA